MCSDGALLDVPDLVRAAVGEPAGDLVADRGSRALTEDVIDGEAGGRVLERVVVLVEGIVGDDVEGPARDPPLAPAAAAGADVWAGWNGAASVRRCLGA
jgi:hypothetical protein